ncbi:MAG: succinylglutamate desuccinylase/aspartoacylase family protein [Candidatus Poribacteria bacterium]|nr:succinylglutamate desuccinylase/aspartoacylase family protein [Candidatus Poribacteria bacterium]
MLQNRTDSLRVGNLVAHPGERIQGYLRVGEMQDGTQVRLPVILIRGVEPGPVVYIQSVSDGDELNGIGVVHRFIPQIDAKELRGGLIIVPLVNFHAFHARQHMSPVDGKKMNRCFPGRADGSSSERIAHTLFHTAVLQADLCIDLHQGGVRPMIDEVRVRVGQDHPMHKACLELAKVFGIGYILDEQGPSGQLAQAGPDHQIPTIDPELGGCHGWDEVSIRKGVQGLWNVMYHYGLIDGSPSVPETQYVVYGFVPIRANRGGFVTPLVGLYDLVTGGQELAIIKNIFGDPVETITTPVSGIVWSTALYPMAATGETIITIGAQPNIISNRETV